MALRAVLLCTASLLLGLPVQAASGRIDWPTFLRLAPGTSTRVVAELSRGTEVDVRSCDGQWCLVQVERTLGYVKRGALEAATSPASVAVPATHCFDSIRSGYGAGEAFRYCGNR